MKYTDPDGRVIDASELDPGDYLVFEKAMPSLESTKRDKELINRLSVSPRIFKIKTNRDAKNSYSPLTKTINWDPPKVLYTSDDSAINPEVLLAHEKGLRLNFVYNCPLTLENQRKLRILNIQIYTSLLRVGGGISNTSK